MFFTPSFGRHRKKKPGGFHFSEHCGEEDVGRPTLLQQSFEKDFL
jgi:hypothetical protein